MGWNPYSDLRNSAYVSILTTLFPEQTKTLPRIIVWSIIFLLDLIFGIVGAFYFGFLESGSKLVTGLLLAAIVVIFWLQGRIWFGIVNYFRRRNTLD